LTKQGFGTIPVPGEFACHRQLVQDVGVAEASGLLGQGFGPIPVPGFLPHLSQLAQGVGVAMASGLPG
jgi:hypothetical protein